MPRRTPVQLAFAAVGLIALALGIRNDDGRLVWVAIAFFGVATLLRFYNRAEH